MGSLCKKIDLRFYEEKVFQNKNGYMKCTRRKVFMNSIHKYSKCIITLQIAQKLAFAGNL